MARKRAWTADEFEKLRSMIEAGASAIRISVALRRPVESVKDRAREMGIPFAHDRVLKRERKKLLGTGERQSN